jgi:Ca2+-binding RTX toxin-like protein
MPTFTGTNGNEEIIGSEGDDIIDGRFGFDRIYGRGGADVIRGILGAEEVYAGTGNDTVIVDRTPAGAFGTSIFIRLIDGGEGVDTLDLSSFSAVPFVLYQGGGRFETASGDPSTIVYSAPGSTALNYQGQATVIRGFERIIGPDAGQTYVLGSVTTVSFLQGGAGADYITLGGTATIRGGAGDDTISVAPGQRVFGESGNDSFSVGTSYAVPAFVDGGEGQDILRLNPTDPNFTFVLGDGVYNGLEYRSIEGLYLLRGGPGVFNINVTGTDRADYFYAQGYAGTVSLGAGNDYGQTDRTVVLDGGDGNDILNGYGTGALYGGAGDDILTGVSSMFGGDGDDVVVARGTLFAGAVIDGGAGFDTFSLADDRLDGAQLFASLLTGRVTVASSSSQPTEVAFTGFERIVGGGGGDTITLGLGHEEAFGGARNDILRGAAGNDILYGDAAVEAVTDGADQLFGDEGDDLLFGGGGNDTLMGGIGDDVLDGGSGADILDGGEGYDLAVYTIARSAASISYADGAIRIEGLTGATDILRGIEAIRFADGVYDVINGQVASQPRAILGSTGVDRLVGTAGSDFLSGGAGNDILRGDAGSDLIDGGAGVDTAVYGGMKRTYSTVSGSLVIGGAEGGVDQLSNVEVLQFLDGRLSFDINDASAVVYRLYDTVFDRAPDVFGLADFSRAISEGRATVQQILEAFVGSEEYRSRFSGMNDEQFVRELYRSSLNREGEDAGVAFYTGALTNGSTTRLQLLMIFSESPEHRSIVDAVISTQGLFIQDEKTISIARMYDTVFDRVPDLAGLQSFRDALDRGYTLKDVGAAFVASPEFLNRFGALSDQQFVEQLYRAVLDREGDAAGIRSFVDALSNGYSRADVVLVFSESPEHRLVYQNTWETQVRNLGVGGFDPERAPAIETKATDAFVLPAEPVFEAGPSNDPYAAPEPAAKDDGQIHQIPLDPLMALDALIATDDLSAVHHRSDWM